LAKVFASTVRSNLAAPLTHVTSNSIITAQNAKKSHFKRLRDATYSVASVQRKLDPLASSDVVKRLTN